MKLGVLRNTFLPLSETFISEQINQYTSSEIEIITREVINSNSFIFDKWSINSLVNKEVPKFIKFMQKLFFTLNLTSYFKISKIIKQKDIDIIHAHFGVDAVYAIRACKKNDIPLIVTFHGYDITRLPRFKIYPFSYLIYFFNYKELAKRATLCLAVSNHIKTKLIERGFPKEKILVHYIGIDLDKIPYREESSINCNEEIVITTVGRLTEKKGTEYLIYAFDKLYKEYKNISLKIVGDGPLKDKLTSVAMTCESSDKIDFLGNKPHEEVISILKKSHIFSLPSITAFDGDQEGLGMVILEASATGLPIVATRSGGIVDAVKDNETGYLVEERNIEQLSSRLKKLVEDEKLRTEMGKNGRTFMEEKFDIKKQTKKLELLYQKYVSK
ncbi:glycosyltransferase [Paenibacillus shunpengii]|uniref:Glycosyltransferase n=1 Tax=Paenibacillus shunpengii TaxID=2054424 RepID=A0ABW5SJ96_9BACL